MTAGAVTAERLADTMDEWLSPELLIRRLAAAHELIRQKEVAPLIDYKFVVAKNFDALDEMKPMLEESGSKIFCSASALARTFSQ